MNQGPKVVSAQGLATLYETGKPHPPWWTPTGTHSIRKILASVGHPAQVLSLLGDAGSA